MKTSLCMIVGNVQEYIERCLESFLGSRAFDEVVLVRAIGNQTPDQTFDIACKVASKHNIPLVVGHYENSPEHDWPHVDNFAAARQMSYDLATGDYCFWCDSDDVLASGGERIRELAKEAKHEAFLFPYEIIGRGVTLPRERMMFKSSGKWAHRVHECFEFYSKQISAIRDDSVLIQHKPKMEKTGSNERNLRILESCPPEEMTCGMQYHLFCELLPNAPERAIEIGTALVARPDIGKAEHYAVLLELMLHANNPETRRSLLHEAYRVDPTRREALGVLSGTAMDMGDADAALAYASQMIATPEPAEHCWNSRRSFYSYVGEDIYQQALRFSGRKNEAEMLRRDAFARHSQDGTPIISLLHATRGRPALASKTRKLWFDLAERPELVEHIFAIDADDAESAPLARMHTLVVPAGGGCVAAWNAAAYSAGGSILVQLSDDWTPPIHWDKILRERIGDVNKPSVLAISDGHRKDDLLCMAICTQAYYQTDGFLFHPWFKGVYSDNWFSEQAYRRGVVIDAKDVVFNHNHYFFTGSKPDETYKNQNSESRYREGLEVLMQLQSGKEWSSIPGFFNYQHWYSAMANKLKDGDTVVEVGSWMGRSIVYLAQELKRLGKNNVRLYAVDHFKGESNQKEHEATVKLCGGSVRSQFEANIARCGVSDMITVLEGNSWEQAAHFKDGTVDFCWIDAAHDYESVLKDVKAWMPKIKPGGVLSGHDAQWHEVRQAVTEIIPTAKFMGCLWIAN